jgi:hypothetical protein
MRKSTRLPTRFPKGAKYVLEADGGYVRRYVEFPDGRRIVLARRKAMICTGALPIVGLAPSLSPMEQSVSVKT